MSGYYFDNISVIRFVLIFRVRIGFFIQKSVICHFYRFYSPHGTKSQKGTLKSFPKGEFVYSLIITSSYSDDVIYLSITLTLVQFLQRRRWRLDKTAKVGPGPYKGQESVPRFRHARSQLGLDIKFQIEKGKKETTPMLAPICRRMENLAPALGRNIFSGRFLKSLFLRL